MQQKNGRKGFCFFGVMGMVALALIVGRFGVIGAVAASRCAAMAFVSACFDLVRVAGPS